MNPTDQLEPKVFVIFGGAGDLTWRKLVPALFDLSQNRSMPADFAIIAVDRVDLSVEKLRRHLHDNSNAFQGGYRLWAKPYSASAHKRFVH